LDKITPVGVAVLVDALNAQNVYSAFVKRNELLLLTITARTGGWWWRALVCIASLQRAGLKFLVSGSEQRFELSLEQKVRAARRRTGVQVASVLVEFGREHQTAEASGEHSLAVAGQTNRVAAEQHGALRVLAARAHTVSFSALVLVPNSQGPLRRSAETI